MRVLITGAAGYVGRQLTRGLERDFDLRLGDLHPPLEDPRGVRLDVTRLEDARAAVQDMDAVIHLAIASGHEGDYEEEAFNQLRFDVNVKGTWTVLEAARHAGVKRFVFTSSIMVLWGHPAPAPVPADAPPWPVGTYALTKFLGEQVCAQFARQHGLSLVCLRIPKPVALEDPYWKSRPIRPQWLAFPDLVQAYRLALTVPDLGFETVTVVGESSRRRWDLSRAARVLGYRPSVRLEDLGYQLGDERASF